MQIERKNEKIHTKNIKREKESQSVNVKNRKKRAPGDRMGKFTHRENVKRFVEGN